MIRSPVWLLAAIPLLAGCMTSTETPEQKVTATKATPAQTPPQVAETVKSTEPAVASRVTEPTCLDIKALKGKSSDRVTVLLGVPDFRRTDRSGEIWQYRHDKCSVDLFFYPRDGGGLGVDFMDVRAYGEQDLSLQACFVAILKEKAGANGRG